MRDIKILIVCSVLCALTGVFVYQLGVRNHKKIAVVDAVKLFDRFNMKIELEAKEKIQLEAMKKQIDSIENQLRMANASRDKDAVNRLSYSYNYLKAGLEQEYTRGNREINEQVWKRLNPAVEQFGKMKKLDVIIGANGMGSVLYNDADFDLTEELIKYVNKNYEGGD